MPKHSPVLGAVWMLIAGVAFALVNTTTQYIGTKFQLPSTMSALFQYGIALIVILPYLHTLGIRESLRTKHFGWHAFRVFLSVIGIQLWYWALMYVPIWQAIALLLASPLFATVGAGILLKENIGAARWIATLTGFAGGMIILAPWADDFTIASLLPVGAAFFWACYSLMVKKMSVNDSPSTMVVYLLLLLTPFNILVALPEWTTPVGWDLWLFLIGAGAMTALGQWAIVKAYSIADASFVQPFDLGKLPFNVFLGWLVFTQVPPGNLWLGASLMVGAILFITQWEHIKKNRLK